MHNALLANKDHSPATEWFVVSRSSSCRTVRDIFDTLSDVFCPDDLYWPLVVKQSDTDSSLKPTPLLPSYMFVKAERYHLQRLFNEESYRSKGFLLRKTSDDGMAYQTIPDHELERFRWFCENHSDYFFRLDQKLYSDLKECVKVRVIKGELAGMEGVIQKFDKDRHFVFNVGNLAIVAKNLVRSDLEVIGGNQKMHQSYSIHQQIHTLQNELQKLCHAPSSATLSRLVLYTIYHSTLTSEQLKAYKWISTDSGLHGHYGKEGKRLKTTYVLRSETEVFEDAHRLAAIVSSLSDLNKERLRTISAYIIATHHQLLTDKSTPDLSSLFYDDSHPPFMTLCPDNCDTKVSLTHHDSHAELTMIVKVPEEEYSFYKSVTNFYTTDYLAHIMLMPRDGGVMVMTDWTECYDAVTQLANDHQNGLPELLTYIQVADSEAISFRHCDGIKGLGLFVPDATLPANVKSLKESSLLPRANELIAAAIKICKQVRRSTHFRVHQHLLKSWIKAVPSHIDTYPLYLTKDSVRPLLRRYAKKHQQVSYTDFCNHLLSTLADPRYSTQPGSYRLITKEDLAIIKSAINKTVGTTP